MGLEIKVTILIYGMEAGLPDTCHGLSLLLEMAGIILMQLCGFGQ